MKNIFNKIRKPNNFYIKTNLLENRYITDGHIWTVDETIFNQETKVFLVVSLKTRAILGFIQASENITDDIIIELYDQILSNYSFKFTPVFVHSDMEESYHSKKVIKFLEDHKIYISVTEGYKNQNQVSESINNRIKYLVTELLTNNTNSKSYRSFTKTLPENLRVIQKQGIKCQDKDYRKHLFKSKHFKNNRQNIIYEAILKYNKTPFTEGISREQAQYLDSFLKSPSIENTQLVESNHIFANKIKHDNITSIQQVNNKLLEILKEDIDSEKKVSRILSLVFLRQDNTDNLLKQGFIGITIQNTELQQKLDHQIAKTEVISKRLEEVLKQQELAEERKRKRRNRERRPKRDPLTEELYQELINRANIIYRETYKGARLRLALALLAVTGVRISELLPLKVNQIENMFTNSWIAIDRLKRGPANHKAFLTPKGKQILKQRAKDFEIIMYLKNEDSFVFTPQNSEKPLCRQAFNRIINSFINDSIPQMRDKPNLKSYSFRIGFITDLWRDCGDIEFVRQAIGHARVDTTSNYVENLTEEERQDIMNNIKSKKKEKENDK